MKKAVILLSGGLDSTTTLYEALSKGYRCYCLIVNYGQRHHKEILIAKKIAQTAGCEYQIVKIDMPWKGSALLDKKIALPRAGVNKNIIPATYVPARNIIFLSLAASYAEAMGATTIFIGANALDYSGYPDCRPAFIKAYQQMLSQGLKTTVEGKKLEVKTPLIQLSKAAIIRRARRLGVPVEQTWSCYQGGKKPCGVCDSCRLRQKGFDEAGL